MESSQRWSVGWFGIGLAALLLGGCARKPSGVERPGELELEVEPGASYGVVGRFRVVSVEPAGTGREVDFGADTTTARLPLAPGAYVLTLHAGARIVCREDDATAHAEPSAHEAIAERLVSSWPRRISIESGEVTMARINFGAPPAPHGVELADAPVPRDPCATFGLDGGTEQALLSR
jgi:hypothetical protein